MNTYQEQNTSHDYFDLDIRVVKQEANNSTPDITSIVLCTSGCQTNGTCATCTCQNGCLSDWFGCGTRFTC